MQSDGIFIAINAIYKDKCACLMQFLMYKRVTNTITRNHLSEIPMTDKLSKTDHRILELLQHDARLSATDIAEQVGLSQSPCWRRINRLEESGVIRRRVALVDREKLGFGMMVFVMVNLSAHGRQYLEDFERAVRELPEVLECFTITGTSDYMLKIVTRDTHHYERFMRHQLSHLEAVHEFHSFVALTEIKYSTALPIAGN